MAIPTYFQLCRFFVRSQVARLMCDAAAAATTLSPANAAAEFCMSQKYASHHEAPNLFLQIHSSLVEIKLYEDASDKNAYRHAMKVIHLYVQGNLTLEVLLRIQNICKHL